MYIVQHLIRFSQSDWSKAQDAELRNFGCCTPQACDIHPDCCTLVSHHNKRHNNCAALLLWICAIFSRTEIVLWMKYALRFGRTRAGYI